MINTDNASKIEKVVAIIEDCGKRLDVFIAEKLNISRSSAQGLEIFYGEKSVPKNYRLVGNEIFFVKVPNPQPLDAKPQDIKVDIIYEDDDLLVVNKPQGMVVHPAAGNPDGTLVNALLHICDGRLSSINGQIRPGIVHRIDKDTAGLLIVAKNDFSHQFLAKQIAEHSFTRQYRAILWGNLREDEGTVDAPIGRHRTDRKRMAVTDMASRRAVTHYKVIERSNGFTHTALTLETGRTHQIRVHMAHLGHPVVGDFVYAKGRNTFGLVGQCLFAEKIGFRHPTTNEYLEFNAPLPDFFNAMLKKCGMVE